jgi:predicted RNA-binding protein with EMAP domain
MIDENILFLESLIQKILNNTITPEELIQLQYMKTVLSTSEEISNEEKDLQKYLTAGYVLYNLFLKTENS